MSPPYGQSQVALQQSAECVPHPSIGEPSFSNDFQYSYESSQPQLRTEFQPQSATDFQPQSATDFQLQPSTDFQPQSATCTAAQPQLPSYLPFPQPGNTVTPPHLTTPLPQPGNTVTPPHLMTPLPQPGNEAVPSVPPPPFPTPPKLRPVEKILSEIPGKDVASLRLLAVALARDAIFGREELAKKSLSGRKNTSSLDPDKLNYIKTLVRSRVPQTSKVEFEFIWTHCRASLSKSCQSLRSSARKKL